MLPQDSREGAGMHSCCSKLGFFPVSSNVFYSLVNGWKTYYSTIACRAHLAFVSTGARLDTLGGIKRLVATRCTPPRSLETKQNLT